MQLALGGRRTKDPMLLDGSHYKPENSNGAATQPGKRCIRTVAGLGTGFYASTRQKCHFTTCLTRLMFMDRLPSTLYKPVFLLKQMTGGWKIVFRRSC